MRTRHPGFGLPHPIRDERGRGNPGFTLIELLVVIAIISILMLFLVVGVRGASLRAQIHKTEALIQALEQGCITYKENFGAGTLSPPMDKGSSQSATTGDSSKNLVYYLGERLLKQVAFSNVPGVPVPPPEPQAALMQFSDDQMDSGCLVDAWGRRILYCFYNPKAASSKEGTKTDAFAGATFDGHDKVNNSTAAHVDIVSYGPFEAGVDDDTPPRDCKVSSWKKQVR